VTGKKPFAAMEHVAKGDVLDDASYVHLRNQVNQAVNAQAKAGKKGTAVLPKGVDYVEKSGNMSIVHLKGGQSVALDTKTQALHVAGIGAEQGWVPVKYDAHMSALAQNTGGAGIAGARNATGAFDGNATDEMLTKLRGQHGNVIDPRVVPDSIVGRGMNSQQAVIDNALRNKLIERGGNMSSVEAAEVVNQALRGMGGRITNDLANPLNYYRIRAARNAVGSDFLVNTEGLGARTVGAGAEGAAAAQAPGQAWQKTMDFISANPIPATGLAVGGSIGMGLAAQGMMSGGNY